MYRPTIWISTLAAMLSAELASAFPAKTTTASSEVALMVVTNEPDKSQQIKSEALQSIGKELADL